MRSRYWGAVILIALMLMSWSTMAQEDYDITFTCNMIAQTVIGNFNPAEDSVDVRGGFNGWSGPIDVLSPVGPNLYGVEVSMVLTPIETMEYKFVIENSGGTLWENRDNRSFTVDGTEVDVDGDSAKEVVLDTVFFDDLSSSAIFINAEDIIFEVDMSPAQAYLDSFGVIPFGGANVTNIDSVFLSGNGTNTTPEMGWVWDLSPGDPIRSALQMNDSGLDGDSEAGDGIWSITLNFGTGALKNIIWKFSINGYDNESGFAQDHFGNVDDPTGRVRRLFGSNGDLYDDFLELVQMNVSVDAAFDPVPVQGDTFPVILSMTNFAADTIVATLWIDMELPNGAVVTALAPKQPVLPPFTTLVKPPIIRVSGNGPAGTYTLKVYWAANGDTSCSTSTFSKSALSKLDGIDLIPSKMTLAQNYPNPFNPSTSIQYGLSDATRVTLRIYNALGQEVRTLVNSTQNAGYYSIVWDGSNNNGQKVTSGIYFYQMTTGEFIKTQKMLFAK